MNAPILSIIIPVYNVAPYLADCLTSINRQWFTQFEVIVINDGSTDHSLHILKEFKRKMPQLRVVSQKNAGQSIARNQGIRLARGKYIHFLDGDDHLVGEVYKHLICQMETYHLDLIRFSATPFLDGVNGTIFSGAYDYSRYFDSEKVYQQSELVQVNSRTFAASPCLFIVRRQLLMENDIMFEPEVLLHEDELFTLTLFLHAERMMYAPYSYYRRRYRKQSVMTTRQTDNAFKSFISYVAVINKMERMIYMYHSPLKKGLIKKRLGKLYGITTTTNVPRVNREKHLSAVHGIRLHAKVMWRIQGKLKIYIKKLLHLREFI